MDKAQCTEVRALGIWEAASSVGIWMAARQVETRGLRWFLYLLSVGAGLRALGQAAGIGAIYTCEVSDEKSEGT